MTSAIQNPGILIRIFPPAAAADRQNPLMVDGDKGVLKNKRMLVDHIHQVDLFQIYDKQRSSFLHGHPSH